jgi:hypothetical protein
VATRAAQTTQGLSAAQAPAFVERHGLVCEASRRGAIPSLVDAVAGQPVHGNWWSHARRREIFAATRAVRASADVLVCRLIDGKITFVHRRLWPALLRLAERIDRSRLARLREIHSVRGKHIIEEIPFPEWAPRQVVIEARGLSEVQAQAELGQAQFPLSPDI